MSIEAEVTICGVFSMQVCVPESWTDEQTIEFAEKENPCGTENGWFVRSQESAKKLGHSVRVPCAEHQGKVHMVLDA